MLQEYILASIQRASNIYSKPCACPVESWACDFVSCHIISCSSNFCPCQKNLHGKLVFRKCNLSCKKKKSCKTTWLYLTRQFLFQKRLYLMVRPNPTILHRCSHVNKICITSCSDVGSYKDLFKVKECLFRYLGAALVLDCWTGLCL